MNQKGDSDSGTAAVDRLGLTVSDHANGSRRSTVTTSFLTEVQDSLKLKLGTDYRLRPDFIDSYIASLECVFDDSVYESEGPADPNGRLSNDISNGLKFIVPRKNVGKLIFSTPYKAALDKLAELVERLELVLKGGMV